MLNQIPLQRKLKSEVLLKVVWMCGVDGSHTYSRNTSTLLSFPFHLLKTHHGISNSGSGTRDTTIKFELAGIKVYLVYP